MKKQFSYLMMLLAMVILAGTNAMAVSDGTSTNPFVHANGSTHNLTVTGGGGTSTFAWTTDAGTACTLTAADQATCNIVWAEDATGSYYFDVTEKYDAIDGSQMECQTTTRRVHIFLIKMDVEVYISDATGAELSGAALLACGTGTTATFGDEPAATGGVAFSNMFNSDGDLAAYDPKTSLTPRYIGFKVTWVTSDLVNEMTFTTPDVASLSFSYSVDAGTDNADFSSLEASTALIADNIKIAEVSENIFVADLLWNPRWGKDISYKVTATNCVAYDSGDAVVGMERSTEEAGAGNADPLANTTANEVILGAPSTSRITTD